MFFFFMYRVIYFIPYSWNLALRYFMDLISVSINALGVTTYHSKMLFTEIAPSVVDIPMALEHGIQFTPSIQSLLLFLYTGSNYGPLQKMEPDLKMKTLETSHTIPVHRLS